MRTLFPDSPFYMTYIAQASLKVFSKKQETLSVNCCREVKHGKTMSLQREHRGLTIPDIGSIIQSKRIMLLLKIHFTDKKTLMELLRKSYLKSIDSNYNLSSFLLQMLKPHRFRYKHVNVIM